MDYDKYFQLAVENFPIVAFLVLGGISAMFAYAIILLARKK